jgi:hypothetical protein
MISNFSKNCGLQRKIHFWRILHFDKREMFAKNLTKKGHL